MQSTSPIDCTQEIGLEGHDEVRCDTFVTQTTSECAKVTKSCTSGASLSKKRRANKAKRNKPKLVGATADRTPEVTKTDESLRQKESTTHEQTHHESCERDKGSQTDVITEPTVQTEHARQVRSDDQSSTVNIDDDLKAYRVEGRWERFAAVEEVACGKYIVADDDMDPYYASVYMMQTRVGTYPTSFQPDLQRGGPVCRLTARVGRFLIDCCVDSGASFTLINAELYDKLRLEFPTEVSEIESTTVRLKGATGDPIPVRGVATISFLIERTKLTFRMIVGGLAGVDCLLGVDWLHATGADIDFRTMTMKLGPQRSVYLRSIPLQLFATTRVRTTSPVDVEPRQSRMVKCTASTDFVKAHTNAIFEADVRLREDVYIHDGAIPSEVNSGIFEVLVSNHSMYDVMSIDANTEIGRLDDIAMINRDNGSDCAAIWSPCPVNENCGSAEPPIGMNCYLVDDVSESVSYLNPSMARDVAIQTFTQLKGNDNYQGDQSRCLWDKMPPERRGGSPLRSNVGPAGHVVDASDSTLTLQDEESADFHASDLASTSQNDSTGAPSSRKSSMEGKANARIEHTPREVVEKSRTVEASTCSPSQMLPCARIGRSDLVVKRSGVHTDQRTASQNQGVSATVAESDQEHKYDAYYQAYHDSEPGKIIAWHTHPVIDSEQPGLSDDSPSLRAEHNEQVETPRSASLPSHLEQLVPAVEYGPLPREGDRGCQLMTAERVARVTELLIAYQDVFVGPDGKVGYTNITGHRIDTGNAEPIRTRPFRKSLTEKQYIEEEVQRLLSAGQISPSQSPWAAPVVLVKKKDGTLRFCIDYRRLNSVTKKDAYPLPRIDECLEALNGCEWFTTLDLASGYWQVAMEEGSKEKTCFVTSTGLYEWNVMPFGLCNAPATFSRLMENVLNGLIWRTCLVYLDDIIAVGDCFDKALANLEGVFARLRLACLKLKPKKCELFKRQVEYLGHEVSVDGIRPSASKVQALLVWKPPRDVHEIRSFLGFVSYYRKFIRMFAEKAAPLSDCTGPNYVVPPEGLNDAQMKSFETLRKSLMKNVKLNYVVEDRDWILDCDASNVAIGACLHQIDSEGTEHLISCASKILSKSRRHYCTTRKELYCVVFMLRYHRGYIRMCDPKRLKVRVDHGSLKWLLTFNFQNELYRRWIAELQAYGDFQIIVRPGSQHKNADAASRIITRDCQYDLCNDCISVFRSQNSKLHDSDSTSSDEETGSTTNELAVVSMNEPRVKTSFTQREFRKMIDEGECSPLQVELVKWEYTISALCADLCAAVTRQQTRATDSRNSNSETPTVPELRRSSRVAERSQRERERDERKESEARGTSPVERSGRLKDDLKETSKSTQVKETADSPVKENVDEKTFDPCGQKGTRERIIGGKLPDELANDIEREWKSSKSTDDDLPPGSCEVYDLLSQLLPAHTPQEWVEEQQADVVLRRVMVLLDEGSELDLSDSMETRRYLEEKGTLFLNGDGVLSRRASLCLSCQDSAVKRETIVQRVVPGKWQREIFCRIHRIECIHFGFPRVYIQIWRRFYWVTMVKDIRTWLRTCDNCQHYKPGILRELRKPIQDPMGEPLDRVAMDLAELPCSERGNRYLLVVQDYFSKFVELYALPTKESKPIAEILHKEFFTRYGVPLKLYSDKGREFNNALMDELCDMWKIARQTTCGYNPAANGMVERTNRTVKNLLAQMDHVDLSREDWDLKLAEIRCAYNSTVHSTTGFTPHRLMFSQSCDPRLPVDLFYDCGSRPTEGEKPPCYNSWVMNKREVCREVGYHAQRRTAEALQERARHHRVEHRRVYQEGQEVLRYYPPNANQKLHSEPFTGPWKIVSVCDEKNTVVLRIRQKNGQWIEQVVAIKHIKPYLQDADGVG